MTLLKTDENMSLFKLQSFGLSIFFTVTKNNNIRRNSSVLIAIGTGLGLTFLGDVQAAKSAVIDSKEGSKVAVEKNESVRHPTTPGHLPQEVVPPGGTPVVHRIGPYAEVPGMDYTKHPPQPLKMAPGALPNPDNGIKKIQIVNSRGRLQPGYLSYLRAFKEKPFSEIKDLGKILRFVLIDSTQTPILITVDFKTKSGTATLSAKTLDKKFRVDKGETVELTPEQADSLTDKIEYPGLWKEVPYTKTSGEYSYWILEAWDGKRYQTATEFMPTDGYIKELGDELLSLTEVHPIKTTKTTKPKP